MIRFLLATSIVLVALSPAWATDLPFIGKWDCGVGTFTFTAKTYDGGEGPMKIKSLKREGNQYILSFAKGYKIGVGSVTAKTMHWFSFASGDDFDCKRL